MPKTERLQVPVEPETRAQLERLAKEQDVSLAHIIRQAIRQYLAALTILLIVLTASLATAPSAAAKPDKPGLHISGMRPVYWTWVADASKNVPLPNASLSLWRGDPEYVPDWDMILLPWPGHEGWTPLAVHGLLIHELGHVYDAKAMTPARREAFKAAVGTTCKWMAAHCVTERWVTRPISYVDVRPAEMFAETYMACALGLTRMGVEAVGYNSYGWVPPEGTDETRLCSLIRGA